MHGLSALVPAAVHGLLGDLAIAAPEGIDGLDALADHAGCKVREAADAAAALRLAVSKARYDDILILTLGYAPVTGFHLELEGLRQSGIRTCIMRAEPQSFTARLLPFLCRKVMLVAPRSEVVPLIDAGTSNVSAMARRLRDVSIMQAKAIHMNEVA